MSTIKDMIDWQAAARPEPTERQFDIAVGVHVEEFVEMLDSLVCNTPYWWAIKDNLHELASSLKSGEASCSIKDRVELLDAMCDQVVTATGVAHCAGFKFMGALKEVNRSNWSKFVDGKPKFNSEGKISKGPNYSRPNLDSYA